MKLKLQKSKLKLCHLFYIAFFVLYLAGQYYFLYHVNDLNPFQLNIHFFSNAIASLSKRFISEAAVYALIFYLLYYTKALWKRVLLTVLFLFFFLINILAIGFYVFTRSNFQFYILEGFNWNIFFSYFTPKLTIFVILLLVAMAGMAYALLKIKNKEKEVWLLKKRLFLAFLIILAFSAPYLPIQYNNNTSLFFPDPMLRKTFRTISLDKNGFVLLIDELRYHFFPDKPVYRQLSDEEEKSIESKNLDTQTSQDHPNPPKKIILVIAESLNQKFISYYNKEITGATPYLNSLFEEYPHIDDFYPSGIYTLHGIGTAVCGHTNSDQIREHQGHECVPKLLSEAGYKNEFIRGASKYFISENIHFTKFGYDSIFAKEEFEKKYPDFTETHNKLYKEWGYTDNFIFDEAIDRLKESKPEDKLFLTLLTVDTHIAGGRCYYEKTEKDPEDPLMFSIECFDRVFKDFMEKLKKEGLFDEDLLIILTADQLYPGYSDIAGDELKTSFMLKPSRIPFLMITDKDLELKAHQGSHVDIASTILDLVGIEIPSYYMGKSLVSNGNAYPMGQDRQNGYLIIGDEFYSLSLDPKPFKQDADGPKSFAIEIPSNATDEELDAIIGQKAEEYNQEQNQEEALYKWYYNKFYDLSLDQTEE